MGRAGVRGGMQPGGPMSGQMPTGQIGGNMDTQLTTPAIMKRPGLSFDDPTGWQTQPMPSPGGGYKPMPLPEGGDRLLQEQIGSFGGGQTPWTGGSRGNMYGKYKDMMGGFGDQGMLQGPGSLGGKYGSVKGGSFAGGQIPQRSQEDLAQQATLGSYAQDNNANKLQRESLGMGGQQQMPKRPAVPTGVPGRNKSKSGNLGRGF